MKWFCALLIVATSGIVAAPVMAEEAAAPAAQAVESSLIKSVSYDAATSLLTVVLAPVGAASVIASNVLARVASATFNYTLNRRYVFRSDEGVSTTAPRYAMLAASILAVNTLLLWLLVDVVGVQAGHVASPGGGQTGVYGGGDPLVGASDAPKTAVAAGHGRGDVPGGSAVVGTVVDDEDFKVGQGLGG